MAVVTVDLARLGTKWLPPRITNEDNTHQLVCRWSLGGCVEVLGSFASCVAFQPREP